MRKGYDLPPLNLDVEEAEAVAAGLSLIARTGDVGLWREAERAARKLAQAAPGTRRLVTSSWGMDDIVTVNLGTLRRAIRQEQKVDVEYTDSTGAITARTIWPLALIYYVDAVTIAAWCELRAGLRHFRLDRVQGWSLNDNHFTGQDAALLAQREETQKPGAVTTRTL